MLDSNSDDQIMKQEQLRLLNDNKEYYKAMKLSLDLNRKNDFIETVKNFVISKLYSRKEEDDISMIINNRKILEEDIADKQMQYKERLMEIIKEREGTKGNERERFPNETFLLPVLYNEKNCCAMFLVWNLILNIFSKQIFLIRQKVSK